MIKVGIAGFGKIGQIRANELEKNENSKVVAIFDVIKPDKLNNIKRRTKYFFMFYVISNQK